MATVDRIAPADVRSYLVAVLERTSASTAATRCGGLLAFVKWATGKGICLHDPMADVERPQRPELLAPVLSDDEIRAMLATCGGDFDGIRDAALMRFLLTRGVGLPGRRSVGGSGMALDRAGQAWGSVSLSLP